MWVLMVGRVEVDGSVAASGGMSGVVFMRITLAQAAIRAHEKKRPGCPGRFGTP